MILAMAALVVVAGVVGFIAFVLWLEFKSNQ